MSAAITVYENVSSSIKKSKITKLIKAKKAITVRLKKVKNISGYQIQYSTDSSFTNSKTVNVKKSATSKKIKKLASKTKYYVRVRTYKTVNGVKTYSTWSSTKSVKTR